MQPGPLQRRNRVVEHEIRIGDLAVGEPDTAVIGHVDQQLRSRVGRQNQEGVRPGRPVALEIRDEGEVGVEIREVKHVAVSIERAAAARGDQQARKAALPCSRDGAAATSRNSSAAITVADMARSFFLAGG